ncbi:MAG TPA: phage holin family protein [Actinomycetota bacterium]|nr:phage holin family protein [Actinomycetota bacterium]
MRKAAEAASSNGQGGGISGTISTLVTDIERLVRLEVELAKQEITGLVKRNAVAVGMLVVALLGLLFAFIMFQVWLVVLIPHHAIVAGAIAAFWLLLTVMLALIGKSRLKIEPPKATIQSLKDDLEWVKQQIRPEPK